jgi:hypothetical protein
MRANRMHGTANSKSIPVPRMCMHPSSFLKCQSFTSSPYNIGSPALQAGKHMHGFYMCGSVIVLCYSMSLLDWPPTLDMTSLWPITFPSTPPSFLDRPPSLLSGPSSPLHQYLSWPSPFLNRPLSLLGRPEFILHRPSTFLGRASLLLSRSSSFLHRHHTGL